MREIMSTKTWSEEFTENIPEQYRSRINRDVHTMLQHEVSAKEQRQNH